MGRGATKFITDQATTSDSHAGLPPPGPPPPQQQQPADYHYPFGNPALLISTLPSRKHLPMHLLYRPPAPPVPQVEQVELHEEPESLEVNDILQLEKELPKPREELEAEGFPALEQAMREANQATYVRRADRREAAVAQPVEELDIPDIPLHDRTLDRRKDNLAHELATSTEIYAALAKDQAPLSDQVHILGSDIRAKFLAHNLAGLPKSPPVQLLLNQKYDLDQWKEEGQAINLFRGQTGAQRNRIEAQWIFDRNPRRPEGGRIDQLIVTVPCAATVRAISQIRNRIDHNTTLCLIQEGLGVVEALNSLVFRDPATRPKYVLGHMTHILGYSKRGYTLSEMIPGQLALTAFDGMTAHGKIKAHPPIERRMREAYFLQLLTLNPDLRAGGFRYANFLHRKLPDMVFRSAIDPVVAILGITYDKLLASQYAKSLFRQIVSEIETVVVALPEARDNRALVQYVMSGMMYRHCKARLFRRAKFPSPMEGRVGKGLETEIDFLNGYFVRRGKALGINCPSNDMVIGMLKAKQTLVRTELEKRLPYVGYGPPKQWKQGNGNNGVKKFAPRTRSYDTSELSEEDF